MDDSSLSLILQNAIHENVNPLQLKLVSLEKDLDNLKEIKQDLVDNINNLSNRIDGLDEAITETVGQINQIKAQVITKDEEKKFNSSLWLPIIFGILIALIGIIPGCLSLYVDHYDKAPYQKIHTQNVEVK